MAMWVVPLVQAVVGLLGNRQAEVAKMAGVSEDAVARVSGVLARVVGQDEKWLAHTAEEMERARRHDVETGAKAPPLVELLRGLVRPVVTLTAFFWYVYARMVGVPFGAEDYAIVGGIVAFWFGFRPFEKQAAGRR